MVPSHRPCPPETAIVLKKDSIHTVRRVADAPGGSEGIYVRPRSGPVYRPGNLSNADFSVGQTTGFYRPVIEPSIEILRVVSTPPRPPTPPLPPEIDRRDTTQIEKVVPVGVAVTGARIYTLKIGATVYKGTLQDLGVQANDPRLIENQMGPQNPRPSLPPQILNPPILNNKPKGGPMDLGDLLGQLGTQYLNVKYNQPQVLPSYNQPQVMPAGNFPSVGIPGYDLIPESGVSGDACNRGASPVYKKVCGTYKWVVPKRRRRKALVTQGDLKGLAALKGVLGGGKAFETWIATHS